MGRTKAYAAVIEDGKNVVVAISHPGFDGEYGEITLTPEEARSLAWNLERHAKALEARNHDAHVVALAVEDVRARMKGEGS